jgi:hypothetical protein
MAVDAVRYGSRKKRDRQRAAAKAKRDKIVLVVCLVVLLALVGIMGPKTLKQLHGSSTPAPVAAQTSAASTPAATAGGAIAPGAASSATSLAAISKFRAKDPFVQQLADSSGAGTPAASAATGPPVRMTHFVAKDPFVQQLTLTPVATTPATDPGLATKGGTPAKAGSGQYIIVLASVPLSDGRGAASHAAAAARAKHVSKVSIVDSSKYPTLRTGFYAVYSGPYATLDALRPALEEARGQGYPSAYTRRLAH